MFLSSKGDPVVSENMVYKRTPQGHVIDEEYANHMKASQDASRVLVVHTKIEHNGFSYVGFEYNNCTLEDVLEFIKTRSVDDPQKSWITSRDWGGFGTLAPLKIKVIMDMIVGLREIHNNGIIHQRLNPQSIKILQRDVNVVAKIGDFGSSRLSTNTSLKTSSTLNKWMAPEQMRGSTCSYPVDVFSLGCLIHYILYGSHPFGGPEERTIVNNVKANRLMYHDKVQHSSYLKHFFNNVLAQQPERRLSTNKVDQHPLFWSTTKKMGFLVRVYDQMNQGGLYFRNLKSLMQQKECTHLFIGKGKKWMEELHPCFQKHLKECEYREYTFKNNYPLDLLAAIRNTSIHYDKVPSIFRNVVKSNPDGLLDYVEKTFPSLLIQIYEWLSLNENAKGELKDYY